jgi:hypothetical protein
MWMCACNGEVELGHVGAEKMTRYSPIRKFTRALIADSCFFIVQCAVVCSKQEKRRCTGEDDSQTGIQEHDVTMEQQDAESVAASKGEKHGRLPSTSKTQQAHARSKA